MARIAGGRLDAVNEQKQGPYAVCAGRQVPPKEGVCIATGHWRAASVAASVRAGMPGQLAEARGRGPRCTWMRPCCRSLSPRSTVARPLFCLLVLLASLAETLLLLSRLVSLSPARPQYPHGIRTKARVPNVWHRLRSDRCCCRRPGFAICCCFQSARNSLERRQLHRLPRERKPRFQQGPYCSRLQVRLANPRHSPYSYILFAVSTFLHYIPW